MGIPSELERVLCRLMFCSMFTAFCMFIPWRSNAYLDTMATRVSVSLLTGIQPSKYTQARVLE